jgi:hypothetical protein
VGCLPPAGGPSHRPITRRISRLPGRPARREHAGTQEAAKGVPASGCPPWRETQDIGAGDGIRTRDILLGKSQRLRARCERGGASRSSVAGVSPRRPPWPRLPAGQGRPVSQQPDPAHGAEPEALVRSWARPSTRPSTRPTTRSTTATALASSEQWCHPRQPDQPSGSCRDSRDPTRSLTSGTEEPRPWEGTALVAIRRVVSPRR